MTLEFKSKRIATGSECPKPGPPVPEVLRWLRPRCPVQAGGQPQPGVPPGDGGEAGRDHLLPPHVHPDILGHSHRVILVRHLLLKASTEDLTLIGRPYALTVCLSLFLCQFGILCGYILRVSKLKQMVTWHDIFVQGLYGLLQLSIYRITLYGISGHPFRYLYINLWRNLGNTNEKFFRIFGRLIALGMAFCEWTACSRMIQWDLEWS